MAENNQPVAFQLKSEGSNITGSMAGPNGEGRPIKGELKGDDISLTIASEWEGQPVKLLVKGKVSGSDMKVTMQTEGGEWSTDLALKKGD
jgi:hypothetical protein